MQRLVAAFFSLSFFVPTLVFLAFGKEANVFSVVGLGYLLASLLILWLGFLRLEQRRPRHKTAILSGLGVMLLAVSFPLYYITEKYDVARDNEITAAQRNTEVFELRDEPFFSAAGNLIGVRLHYAVRFPRKGRYAPAPRLLPADEALRSFRGLTLLKITVEPPPASLRDSPLPVPFGRYDANKTYRFTVEMIPFYLIPGRDRSGFCLSFADAAEERLAISDLETGFRIHIDGTSADEYLGGRSPLARHTYNLKRFYDGAVAEGARRPCVFDREGNLH
jgi:hypothetical protein